MDKSTLTPTSNSNPNAITSMPNLTPTTLLRTYTHALKKFTTSPLTFQVLTSLPTPSSLQNPPHKSLYVLDSSFNPPTNAHASIALIALRNDPGKNERPKRLLLLLSVQNADKAAKPASFEQRLVMMHLFALDLQKKMRLERKAPLPTSTHLTLRSETHEEAEQEEEEEEEEITPIDIALTTHPYFVQKSLSISQSASYILPSSSSSQAQQIHLTGYDTLIRILNPKYYPTHDLSSLSPFLADNRLLVFYRDEGEDGGKKEQDEYLEGIRERGGDEEKWVGDGRILYAEIGEEGKGVSSTKVREVVRRGDREELGGLVCDGVREWVLKEGLYLED